MKAKKTGLKTAAEVAAEEGKDFEKEVQAKASEASRYTPPKGWLQVEAQADHVRMTISGPIGASIWDDSGTNSKVFCEALNAIDEATAVRVHINSEGGSVHQALEIYNALKARSNVTTCVDGVALSAASIIALGGDPVISPQSSVWMIHSPRVGTFGDSEEHKRSLKMLDAFRSSMADVYASETGQDKDELLALMDAETWFTGAEAVDFGLADQLEEGDDDTEAAFDRASMVLAMYRPPQNIRDLISTGQLARGGAGTAASKTEKQNQMKETTAQAAATTPPAAQENNNPDLRRFIEERKARITAEVRRRAEGRIKNDNVQWWIDQAIAADNLAGEQAVYAQIDAMPQAAAAEGAPVGRDAGSVGNVDAALTNATMVSGVGGTCYSRSVDKVGHIVEIGVAPDRPRAPFAQEIRRIKTPAERVVALKRDWAGLLNYSMELDMKAAKSGHLPVAANTYSSTLITDYLVDQSITILTNTWAALSCFTRDFSVDRYKPLATGQIKFVTAGATTLVGTKTSNITNFEQGDSSTYPVSVPMSHFSQPYHVGTDELMSGLRMENLTNINLAVFANTIVKAALQPIATGAVNASGNTVAFSAGTYFASSAAGTFGWSTDMPRLRSYLKKSPLKNAILDGSFYSYLLNVPQFQQAAPTGSRADRVGFAGFDQLQENTIWPSTTNTIGGFFCNPQAIGVIAGLPQVPPQMPGNVLSETVITVPGPDISIANYMWFSLASRTLWASFDVVFGAAGGDATAGAVLYDGAGPRS